ncbi:hypothetical protein EDD16DRAFT_1716393 [Pisolithus croceorrhizus]|nr:hypothetical protein EV401DRAFT_1895856 [Pisolithus croceorrhizus]KAI6101695.1 hypothetical protein EDD16DRAFT_1716393 [Pisolithus croceorrhizus]KAI6146071.1 hypothetical protein EDD17DRAFT_1514799 [Pisolithus thermaeus]
MFPNGLFNNPWHSWHSPTQLEDVQMVCQNDLFDDEMSSTSDPADHTSSTAALTQSQVGISSSSAHAQAHTSNLMLHAASQHEVLEPECHINIWKVCNPSVHDTLEALQLECDVWKLCIPSHHNSLKLQHSISHAHTRKGMEPDTPMELGSSVEGRAIPLMAPKCHYEEVNVSQSLQQELYGKEEIINKL